MKLGRQSKILELVSKRDVETQEELAELLIEAGYSVTQATISRDIRELKLTKITTDVGTQKYVVISNSEDAVSEKYIRVLCDGLISMDTAQNILVIKTVSGMAMAVAAAVDHLQLEGVVGCIAGDDTIMCAIRSSEDALRVSEMITRLIGSKKKSN